MDETFETVVVKTETTKEVENMVRKAETLKSLDELNMPKRAKTYLTGKFDSLDEIIWYGRKMSYIYTCYPEDAKKSRKSTLELINALDEAGFIRHDINFCIGRLYRIVFMGTTDIVTMPAYFDDFCETVEKASNSETIYHVDYCMGNEKYESFEKPIDEQLNVVKWSLLTRLTEREYKVIAYRLGFEDGISHSLEQTGIHFCVTRERVRQIEAKALRKLKHSNTLPKIIPSSDEQRAEIATIINEIEELRKDPIFKKEAELRQRLRTISKMPFKCAEEAAKYLDGGYLDSSDIERLGLSVRTYSCLRRAGINTVADIIALPKEDWSKVRNLSRLGVEEIEEKIRAAGLADFSIEIRF